MGLVSGARQSFLTSPVFVLPDGPSLRGASIPLASECATHKAHTHLSPVQGMARMRFSVSVDNGRSRLLALLVHQMDKVELIRVPGKMLVMPS